MKRIIGYKLLHGMMPLDVARVVQEHIEKGWQPYGNPFSAGAYLTQAIVLYEAEE